MNEVRKPETERDTERMRKSREEIERALVHLNSQLGEQQFLAGEFSGRGRSVRAEDDGAAIGRHRAQAAVEPLKRWIDRLAERPSLQKLEA